MSLENISMSCSSSSSSTSSSAKQKQAKQIIRWTTASPRDIQRIVARRNLHKDRKKLLNKNENDEAGTASTCGASCDFRAPVPTHFVAFLDNSAFEKNPAKLNTIAKNVYSLNSNTILKKDFLPPRLQGLQLPRETLDFLKTNGKLSINVYYLSESMARELGVRVYKKRRQSKAVRNANRRKREENLEKNIPVSAASGTGICSGSIPDIAQLTLRSSQIKEKREGTFPQDFNPSKKLRLDQNSWTPPPTWLPFDHKLTLHTYPIKFNTSSWSTWPRNHVCLKAAILIGNNKQREAVALLSSAIFQTPLYSPPKTRSQNPAQKTCPENSDFRCPLTPTEKLTLIDLDGSSASSDGPFSKILVEMCDFHRRFTKVHLLLKKLLSAWILKEKKRSEEKQEKKEKRKLAATKKAGSAGMMSALMNTPQKIRIRIHEEERKFVQKKLKDALPHALILRTLEQIVRMSGAWKLLGSSSNVKKFWRFVKQSVFLGGMTCELDLRQLLSGFNVERCEWLGGVEDARLKWHLMAQAVVWLFQEYILVIFRSSFYATETSGSRNQLAFYLRETWKSVTEKLKRKYLHSRTLVPLRLPAKSNSTTVQQQLTSNNSTSVELTGKLRFVPKKSNSVRSILSHHPLYKKKLDYSLCKYLLEFVSSSMCRLGIPDATAIHRHWRRFINSWRARGCPKLYFLRTDIKDAYPSVVVPKLTQIINHFLAKQGKLTLVRYWQKSPSGRNKLLSFVREAGDSKKPFFIECRPWNAYNKHNGGHLPFPITKAKESLESALASSAALIQVGKKNFTFYNGLPQGWTLSQFLCNIYYGAMDQQYFSTFLDNPEEFFVRNVDDYLFVSADASRVSELEQTMKNGCADFNSTLNLDKSWNNVEDPSLENSIVPFCGWKFCLTSGHVMRDLDSYAGHDACSTLTFKVNSNVIKNRVDFIRNRLKNLTALRLQAMLFDSELNCRRRVWKNLLDAALMAAFRFYAMCRVVLPNLRIFSQDQNFSKSVFGAICVCARAIVRNLSTLKKQWEWGRVGRTTTPRIHSCSEDGNSCVTLKSSKECEGTRTRRKKIGRRNGIPAEVVNKPVQDGNKLTESERENLIVVLHGFILKLSQHAQVFDHNLLRLLRRKRNFLCEQVEPGKLLEIQGFLGKEMPTEFALMKI